MSAQGRGPGGSGQAAVCRKRLPAPVLCQLPTAVCRLPSGPLPTAYCLLPTGRTAGQSTIELAFLVAVVAASLIGLGTYLQRGYQGYLRSNAAAHGVQFDPQLRSFHEVHALNSMSQVQEVDTLSGQAAVDLFRGSPKLPSTPGGTLPGKVLATKVHTESAWDLRNDATYQAK